MLQRFGTHKILSVKYLILLQHLESWFYFAPHFRVVDFASESDMRRAVKRLDGTELLGKRLRLIEVL